MCTERRVQSRGCQKGSWVDGHKKYCTPPPEATAGGLETDRALTRWIDIWRPMLSHAALGALDLPNHAANRNATHILRGEIWPVGRCDAKWPQLELGSDQDFQDDRVHFFVILEDQYGRPLRTRSVSTRTRVAPFFRKISKENSRSLAARWLGDLSEIIDGGDVKALKDYEGLMG
ncbi:hypothetical protein BDN72DRAFT_841680 [Pluteus cervinus]|uniref:Uncharacterized protein n=1 Tax=Pluteus cervinus TaxID=181527 RepID=A0ACD3AS01_9AGAR|nr:hypothetical protein BDN72DRAFT_841680 [Pluteus cervinus]